MKLKFISLHDWAEKTFPPTKIHANEKTRGGPLVASVSGVFDHEDDPFVKEIIKRQKKEAKDLHKRGKVESNGRRQSVAMAKKAKYHSQSNEKDAFKKPNESNKSK